VRACVRYMDDIVWWCDEKSVIKESLAAVQHEIEHGLLLNIKEKSVQINKSHYGISYCGFKIFPGTVKISLRKKKRYAILSQKWEKLYLDGRINENQLARCYDAVHSITANANTLEWRKKYWAQRSENLG
jgi:RNA-directed DNA polymerase